MLWDQPLVWLSTVQLLATISPTISDSFDPLSGLPGRVLASDGAPTRSAQLQSSSKPAASASPIFTLVARRQATTELLLSHFRACAFNTMSVAALSAAIHSATLSAEAVLRTVSRTL
ncbi:hypothetical protein LY76DRAFT_231214 [Colletotrichum caudatum]|nr:hypothetical protein LY76DRAFT_231214 [Colletotrichum caudatum]